MYEDNEELSKLDEEIARVKEMIADRQAKYEEVPQAKTQVGWASYIANNDRGMLDKNQDAERQWYTIKEQERHAKALADAQRAQQDMLNLDENMKNRSLAAINYQYAQQAVELDQSRDPVTEAMLKQKEAEAKATLDYWNKRTGFTSTESQKDEEKSPETPEQNSPDTVRAVSATTLAVDMADMDAYISGKKKFGTVKEQADLVERAKADPAYNTDAKYRDKVNSLEAVKSIEAVKKANEEYKTKLLNHYNSLSPLNQRKWKREHPKEAKAIGV